MFEQCIAYQTWNGSNMSSRGGKRENAGRPRGQGKFGEPTFNTHTAKPGSYHQDVS